MKSNPRSETVTVKIQMQLGVKYPRSMKANVNHIICVRGQPTVKDISGFITPCTARRVHVMHVAIGAGKKQVSLCRLVFI